MSKNIFFEKMHGLGNDFVLIDNRKQDINLSRSLISSLANRHLGIGFDQLLLLDHPDGKCDANYRFFNPDGSEAEQCGNGQRCISQYLYQQNPNKTSFCINGLSGLICSRIISDGIVEVNMGKIGAVEIKNIDGEQCFYVDFGNPHLVTEVNQVDLLNLPEYHEKMTKSLEQDVNFEVVQILSSNEIKLRVHERGTGETLACGSGACATVAALQYVQKLSDKVKVILPGGSLMVESRHLNSHLYLTGPAQHVFTGEIRI